MALMKRVAVVYGFAMRLIENQLTIVVAIGLATVPDLEHSNLAVDTFAVTVVPCMVTYPTFVAVDELFLVVQPTQRQRPAVQIVT